MGGLADAVVPMMRRPVPVKVAPPKIVPVSAPPPPVGLTPPPAPIAPPVKAPVYTGAYGYWQKNPTSYPQYARDWEKGQWAENSTYPGMAPAAPPNKAELSNRNWAGSPVNIGAMGGGQGVQGYSSTSGLKGYTGGGPRF
jgi:hypothetical protein